ncbi:unnamed protein product, partial [marine sediment metagenome]
SVITAIWSASEPVAAIVGVESKVKKLSKARKEELVRDNTRIDEIIKQAGA